MADVTQATSAPASQPISPPTQTPQSPPATTPTPPKAAQPAVEARHKIKVGGVEREIPLSELIALAQKADGADARFQEGAKTRKEAEAIIQYAKENPKEFFAKTGMNARQWAEDFLMEEIQREAMSPEQKKAYENEQRLKQFEAQDKAAKDKTQADQMAALEQKHMESYDKMFIEALTASGLPKTPYTVMRMAQLTLTAEKNNIVVDASQIAKLVREDYIAEQKALFGAADGNAILEMLGKDVVKKLSKAQLAQYKATKVNNAVLPERKESKEKKVSQTESWKAFQKRNRGFV